jgi:putative Se/S carrier protein
MYRDRYAVILGYGTSHALRAEHLLNQAGIKCKLIPVPRHLSSNCGVCVRIERTDIEKAREVLQKGSLDVDGIHDV